MRSQRTVLVKVGGSLLLLHDLPRRLESLFETLGPAKLIVVPGGGPATDFVRKWDRLHQLQITVSHQLAIDSLSLNARLLASVLSGSQLAESAVDLRKSNRVSIVDVSAVFRELHAQNVKLPPPGWHVTSDSLAAWLAIQWRVDEFVLLKSTAAPDELSASSICRDELDNYCGKVSGAKENGAVDDWFGSLIPSLPPLFWCNLRDDSPTLVAFERSPGGLKPVVSSPVFRRKSVVRQQF